MGCTGEGPTNGFLCAGLSYLVPCTHILFISVQMDALGNIGGLLLQSYQHVAGLEVKA